MDAPWIQCATGTADRGRALLYSRWVGLAVLCLLCLARLLLSAGGAITLHPDEAALWAAGQPLGAVLGGDHPLVSLILSASVELLGNTVFALRAPGVIALGLASIAVWRLAGLLYDARVAFWAAVVFATLPVVSYASAIAGTAGFLPLFWAVALHGLLRGLKSDSLGWWLVLGTAFGLGLLTDGAMALLVPCFLVYGILSPEYHALWRRRGLWLALGLGLAIAAPAFWAGLLHADFSPRPTPVAGFAFLVAQVAVFGPIPATVLAWVALHPGGGAMIGGYGPGDERRAADERARRGYRIRFFLSFSLPVVALATLAAAMGGALSAEAAAVAYVGGAILVASWLLTTPLRRGLLRLCVALHILGALLFFNLDGLLRDSGLRPPEGLDPFADLRGMDRVAVWGGELAARYPGVPMIFDDPGILASLRFQSYPRSTVMVLASDLGGPNATGLGSAPNGVLVITRAPAGPDTPAPDTS
ncbi:glycosyltransferase family 39 protein, partial [Rhodospirillum rubrum]|uniref:glycosyltransferase family 39 protein n=2 Tax=Rhodospirillum rubrum TaxID=1085 RepID=UPI00190744D8